MRKYNPSLIGKTHTFTAQISASNIKAGTTDIMVCLQSIKLDGKEVIDHAWIPKSKLQGKLQNGQLIKLEARVVTRKRPAQSIYDAPIIDIQLTNIIFISKLKG